MAWVQVTANPFDVPGTVAAKLSLRRRAKGNVPAGDVAVRDVPVRPNQPPSVTINGDNSGTVGTAQRFQANATDADGTVSQVDLCLMADATTLTQFRVLTTDLYAPYVLDWTPESAGNFYLRTRVTDDKNAVGFSSALNVAVATPTPEPARRQTVGIFDKATNTLVAQPVIDEPQTAGKIKWDGLDIRGNVAPTDRAYQARPISHAADLSVAATWKGVLANNSDSFTGAGVWGSNRPSCMVFRGGKGRYGASYIERGPGHCHFLVSKPGARVLNPNYLTESQSVDAVCSDADRTYHAGVSFARVANPESGLTDTGYFITATNNSDESPYTFPQGYNFRSETQVYSAVDVPQQQFTALGIAVQQQGRVLASLHPDRVVFFDKVQGGAALGYVLLDSPTAIAFQHDGTLAIAHSSTVVELYTFDATALTLTSLRTVPLPAGYVPHSMDFSPVAPTHSILCGGTFAQGLSSTATHRILHYDTRNYDAPPRVDGTGDLGVNPLVSDDTFCFFDAVKFENTGHSYLAYQEDGSYWFMDDGNKREQHRAANGTLLYTRYCAGTTYNPTVNARDATRVFNDYLEYEVDHSKPKTPANTNGWWKLKYNRACFRQAGYTGTPTAITTTPSGHTIGLIRLDYKWVLVAYTTTGLTYFPQISTDLTNWLDRNGDLLEQDGFYAGDTKTIGRRALTGYGDQGPMYADRVQRGSAPLAADTPNATNLYCGPTTDGTYGLFALGMTRFHLGGIKEGATAFCFETAESTWINYLGPFPTKGQYDVGNGVWYMGSFLLSIDNYFIWACRGERWKNGQVVKFIITTSDGRYVGQFGTVRDGAFQSLLEPAAAGQGGNALTGQVVKVGSKYVLMHGDENQHGGIQIWEFDLSTVREEPAYDIVASVPDALPGTDLMGAIPFDNLGFGSGSTVGNWQLMGAIRAETSRDSRTSLRVIANGGGRAYAPFPALTSDLPGYVVSGYYAWHELNGYNGFYYPIAGLELKDSNGVTFLRLAHNDDGNGNTVNTANGVTVTSGVALVQAQETAELRPFRLRVTPTGQLFFAYNGRDEVAIPVFSDQNNQNANPLRPGTVEINFTAYGNGDLKFSVDQLRLLS